MKIVVCVLPALVVAVCAIGSRTPLEDNCYPQVPEQCPRSDPIDECPTCCCNSTENVEFYNPDAPEPECTAPPASYEMKFVFTWSAICHPDYYFPDMSKWSPPTGVSHNTGYRMWDACMDDASEGVGIVSQTGDTTVINQEYAQAAAMGYILDSTEGELVPQGSGMTSSNLIIDKNHQWVSAISMLVPSPDRLVGVADLRLCDGAEWKESVRVCFELFSTATATEKVVGEMERNSLQANNCSFGYVEFNLRKTQVDEPRTDLAEICNPMIPDQCPSSGPIDECPTCCCDSSENVEFYNPDALEPECTAPPASYEMKFVFTWSAICHPDYYFPDMSKWSPPTGVSHNTGYRMWDACMDDASVGVGLVSQTGDTSVINQEYLIAGGKILGMVQGELVPQGSGTTSARNLTIDKDHQWVSAISMLVPSADRLVGVADLRLCDGDEWKESVRVCFELFSTATATEKVVGDMERNSLQANNCSFGYVEFTMPKDVKKEWEKLTHWSGIDILVSDPEFNFQTELELESSASVTGALTMAVAALAFVAVIFQRL